MIQFHKLGAGRVCYIQFWSCSSSVVDLLLFSSLQRWRAVAEHSYSCLRAHLIPFATQLLQKSMSHTRHSSRKFLWVHFCLHLSPYELISSALTPSCLPAAPAPVGVPASSWSACLLPLSLHAERFSCLPTVVWLDLGLLGFVLFNEPEKAIILCFHLVCSFL